MIKTTMMSNEDKDGQVWLSVELTNPEGITIAEVHSRGPNLEVVFYEKQVLSMEELLEALIEAKSKLQPA